MTDHDLSLGKVSIDVLSHTTMFNEHGVFPDNIIVFGQDHLSLYIRVHFAVHHIQVIDK